MKRLVFNSLMLLLNMPGATLKDLMNLLRPATDKKYKDMAKKHYSENIRLYFENDFNSKPLLVTRMSVLTRFENILSNYHMNNIVDAEKSSFDLRSMLDSGKVLLMNLAQGLIGEEGSKVLGIFMVSEITTHALQRQNIPPKERKPIFVYIDEMQNYCTERLDKILSEGRKYKVHLILLHQYLDQLSGEKNKRLKESILANTNIKMFAAVSSKDYARLSKETDFHNTNALQLKHGKFILKVGDFSPVIAQVASFLVDKKAPYYISPSEFKKRLYWQRDQYYVKTFDHLGEAPEKSSFVPTIEKLL